MANYAQRRDELIMSGFRAGDATGEQRTADYVARLEGYTNVSKVFDNVL